MNQYILSLIFAAGGGWVLSNILKPDMNIEDWFLLILGILFLYYSGTSSELYRQEIKRTKSKFK